MKHARLPLTICFFVMRRISQAKVGLLMQFRKRAHGSSYPIAQLLRETVIRASRMQRYQRDCMTLSQSWLCALPRGLRTYR